MALVRFDGRACVPGAAVAVRLAGTLSLVSLFEIDGVTPLPNPLTADVLTGIFTFYAEEAVSYDIVETTGGGDPATREVDAALYVVFTGTSPNRTASLIADDLGAQVILQQVGPY